MTKVYDLANLDALPPEARKQFDSLLSHYPHLSTKGDPEMDTPSKSEREAPLSKIEDDSVLDYDALSAPSFPTEFERKPDDTPKLRVDSREHSFQQKSEKEEAPKENPVEAPQRVPQSDKPVFQTRGKEHPALSKLKNTLGMQVQKRRYVVNIGESEYTLEPLRRDSMFLASGLASANTSSPELMNSYLECALVAYAVTEIDGIALSTIFDVPTTEHDDVLKKVIPISQHRLRDMGAEQMFHLLLQAPSSLTTLLMTHYDQEFPEPVLLKEDSAQRYCPADGCTYKRITKKTDVAYCPYHGEKLWSDEELPNPS